MTVNVTLTIVAGLLFATGIYLLLERSLTRVLLGLMLLTNGANVLLLATGGAAGLAPLISKGTDPAQYNDPLPQALILTSIVISFAVTAFMLALIYRTWQLGRADVVADDIEDREVDLPRRGLDRVHGRINTGHFDGAKMIVVCGVGLLHKPGARRLGDVAATERRRPPARRNDHREVHRLQQFAAGVLLFEPAVDGFGWTNHLRPASDALDHKQAG